MASENNNYQIGNATHVGQERKANEDYFGTFDTANGRLVVVCDGMGGHIGGAIASRTAVEAIKSHLNTNIYDDFGYALSEAIMAANEAILKYGEEHSEVKGMGATCVALLINRGRVFYAHIGDSRIYLIANHHITQLTKDHSFVQMLVDSGQITKEQAELHPKKNEITNAIGLQNMKPATVCTSPIYPKAGYCFLLCTDGLTGMVSDRNIERIVSKSSVSILDRADKLVEAANIAGGLDNITVQLVEFTKDTVLVDEKPKKNKLRKVLLSTLAILFLLLCGIAYWYVFAEEDKKNAVPKGHLAENIKRDNIPVITIDTTVVSKLVNTSNKDKEIINLDLSNRILKEDTLIANSITCEDNNVDLICDYFKKKVSVTIPSSYRNKHIVRFQLMSAKRQYIVNLQVENWGDTTKKFTVGKSGDNKKLKVGKDRQQDSISGKEDIQHIAIPKKEEKLGDKKADNGKETEKNQKQQR